MTKMEAMIFAAAYAAAHCQNWSPAEAVDRAAAAVRNFRAMTEDAKGDDYLDRESIPVFREAKVYGDQPVRPATTLNPCDAASTRSS